MGGGGGMAQHGHGMAEAFIGAGAGLSFCPPTPSCCRIHVLCCVIPPSRPVPSFAASLFMETVPPAFSLVTPRRVLPRRVAPHSTPWFCAPFRRQHCTCH